MSTTTSPAPNDGTRFTVEQLARVAHELARTLGPDAAPWAEASAGARAAALQAITEMLAEPSRPWPEVVDRRDALEVELRAWSLQLSLREIRVELEGIAVHLRDDALSDADRERLVNRRGVLLGQRGWLRALLKGEVDSLATSLGG